MILRLTIVAATSAIGAIEDDYVRAKLITMFTDYKTDSIIQTSLRNELKSDMTLITVAHRLQTIMDADKIVCPELFSLSLNSLIVALQMVLDAGHIVSVLSDLQFCLDG